MVTRSMAGYASIQLPIGRVSNCRLRTRVELLVVAYATVGHQYSFDSALEFRDALGDGRQNNIRINVEISVHEVMPHPMIIRHGTSECRSRNSGVR